MPDSLDLKIQADRTTAVVKCSGRLVAGVTATLYQETRALIAGREHIVLDLTDLTAMDSMGLGTIVRLYVSARSAGCRLELVNINRRVRELLGITNLLSVFELCGERRSNLP